MVSGEWWVASLKTITIDHSPLTTHHLTIQIKIKTSTKAGFYKQ